MDNREAAAVLRKHAVGLQVDLDRHYSEPDDQLSKEEREQRNWYRQEIAAETAGAEALELLEFIERLRPILGADQAKNLLRDAWWNGQYETFADAVRAARKPAL